ncbi:hypothetical protein [Pandoraea aquatica]|uniref:hypothetical protein n=1 Tax=Pandoraea aquatica TaxID=2508290 RepID=UPI00123FB8DF|nr:hypothetical protein [Pandoraea aquatica]
MFRIKPTAHLRFASEKDAIGGTSNSSPSILIIERTSDTRNWLGTRGIPITGESIANNIPTIVNGIAINNI